MLLEICAGNIQDCLIAKEIGAHRIELNNVLYVGGVTPSLALFLEAKEQTQLPIICMVRPRAAGFCYSKEELAVAFRDARLFLEHGAAGIAFGFLSPDQTVDTLQTQKMVELCRQYGADAVFHRAFDVTRDVTEAVQDLISCGVTRILTSGQAATVSDGIDTLNYLQKQFGSQIEFCLGSGVSEQNVADLIAATGIQQVHGTFKHWKEDPTTIGKTVNYSYGEQGAFDTVSKERAQQAIQAIVGS